jgi:hypothetical protein
MAKVIKWNLSTPRRHIEPAGRSRVDRRDATLMGLIDGGAGRDVSNASSGNLAKGEEYMAVTAAASRVSELLTSRRSFDGAGKLT